MPEGQLALLMLISWPPKLDRRPTNPSNELDERSILGAGGNNPKTEAPRSLAFRSFGNHKFYDQHRSRVVVVAASRRLEYV